MLVVCSLKTKALKALREQTCWLAPVLWVTALWQCSNKHDFHLQLFPTSSADHFTWQQPRVPLLIKSQL